MVASVYRLADEVQRRDRDLARQLRRASASVVQNLAGGMYSQGGRKVSRYFDSMGSARETVASLHICVATRQLPQAKVEVDLERLDRIARRGAGCVRAEGTPFANVADRRLGRNVANR
jgi:four helix bundle protein